MRKVSFGSFPLTEIRKEDRKCLDKYLIKTFSDNISISDAIRNIGITKNLMYITPDSLMQTWLGKKQNPTESRGDRSSNSLYEETLKRAFFILKEFYSKIKDAPFYKEYIYYPIYVEKVEKVENKGNEEYDVQVTDVMMNYSFVILSNDLTKNLKIDEIRYDENASLNFLYLFVEFFSGPGFNYSIHDFNSKDLEFLVRLYQFIEKSGKEPIQMVLDLYKLLGLLSRAVVPNGMGPKLGINDRINLQTDINKFFDKEVKIEDLKKYKGMIKHRFNEYLSARPGSPIANHDYRRAFRDIMESIFSSKELSGLYNGVKAGASRGERHQYLYQSNKYREILNLAGELVNYNKLTCKDVISQDKMEIDFKAEHGDRSIEMKSQMASQKYQSFFKTYVESIRLYLQNLIQSLIQSKEPSFLGIRPGVESFINSEIAKQSALIGNMTSGLLGQVENAKNRRSAATTNYSTEMARANAVGVPPNVAKQHLKNAQNAQKIILEADRDINRLQEEIQQIQNFIEMLRSNLRSMDNIETIIGREVYKEIEDYVVSALANDLTFIYDDGKRFFTNELVAKGLLDLMNNHGKKYSLLDCITFKEAANNANSKSIFPQTLDNGKDNPEYFAAQIADSLKNDFDAAAEDAAAVISDYLKPALVQKYADYLNASVPAGNSQPNASNRLAQVQANFLRRLTSSLGATDYKMPASIIETMKNEIFCGRFIQHVLKQLVKMLNVKVVKKIIDFDDDISQLHPLIKKLIKNGDGKCNYFKSFIIDYDMIEQLYRIKYITENQKFLDGIIQQPPRKFNDPSNRMQTVLYDYLGLKNNPVWIISRANIYLSMPDDLSLTNTSLLSNIPKTDLMKVCNIRAADYWNERNMGEATKFGNPKILKLTKDIQKLRQRLSELENDYMSSNTQRNNNG